MYEGMTDPEQDFSYTHNVLSRSIPKITAEFLTNDTYRSNQAKVRWYHEVLSFSPKDRQHINDAMLADIAQQYIAKRNPNALCVAVAHREKEHIHLHFCFSGTEFRSRKTLRMDDETFLNLRLGIEAYQMEKYPQLEHSIVYTGREQTKKRAKQSDRNTRKERLYQRNARTNTSTEKEQLQQQVQQILNRATSKATFFATLKEQGIPLYSYRGKVAGVVGVKRKYRFATLGITKEQLQSLDRLAARYREFAALQSEEKDFGRNR